MLTLRSEQEEALSHRLRRQFGDRMVDHVQEHFPQQFEKLGEENTREVIELGIGRAAVHDFLSERDVCNFIALMLTFGLDFDQDPKNTWAKNILQDEEQNFPPAKMDALYDAAAAHLQAPAQQDPGRS